MSRASQNNAAPVALFPFLAVLLCTMGALVVLMVALSRFGVERAERKAQQLAKQNDPHQQAQLAQLTAYQAQLNTAHQQADKALQGEVNRLKAAEEGLRRQQEKLEALKRAVQELVLLEQDHYDDREQAERELARLEKLIEEGRANLEKLKAEAPKAKKSYAIVPFTGGNGTFRPPIHIECVDNQIILQPEGIVFSAEDFYPPLTIGSPLAAAVRTVQQYYARHPELAGNSGGEPYPLILVRPSGLKVYSGAIRVFQSYNAEYGLQQTPRDWNLAYRNPNPELAVELRNAVELARTRREILAQSAPTAYGEYRSYGTGRGGGANGEIGMGGAGEGGYQGGGTSGGAAATGGAAGGSGGQMQGPALTALPGEEQPPGGMSAEVNQSSAPPPDILEAAQEALSGEPAPWDPQSPSSVSIKRRVQVVVSGSEWRILSDETPPQDNYYQATSGVVISHSGYVNEDVKKLVGALRTHVTNWGLAGEGLHWKPVLVIHASPDGGPLTDQTLQILQACGLEARREEQTAANPGGAANAPR